MHCFLFLMASACAIPSHHLALKQQVGKLQVAPFLSTLLLSAADSLSFPPLPPPGSQTEAHETPVQRVGSTLFWLVLGPCHAAATLVSLPPPQPNSTPRHQSSPSCFQRASSMSLFPQAVLPKDTASCLKSTYWTQPGLLRAGMQTQSLFPNSMYVSRATARERDCTPMAVMRLPGSQIHLCHHSGGDKCEKQNQGNNNFCCFLASGARVASREQAW